MSPLGHTIAFQVAVVRVWPAHRSGCLYPTVLAHPFNLFLKELRMNMRSTRIVVLVALFALATSLASFASPAEPCGLANEIYCQGQDFSGALYASQNDPGGFGNFAAVFDTFTLTQSWNLQSFHWVGGYFNPGPPGNITTWTLSFYDDDAGVPGSLLAFGVFGGNGNETLLPNGLYQYDLYFGSFLVNPGTYWASVVPDQVFPPQWGWATSTQGDGVGGQ